MNPAKRNVGEWPSRPPPEFPLPHIYPASGEKRLIQTLEDFLDCHLQYDRASVYVARRVLRIWQLSAACFLRPTV